MSGFFSNLFKLRDDADYSSLIKNGAVIIDVRTTTEYKLYGHIKGSVNIPLTSFPVKFPSLTKVSRSLPCARAEQEVKALQHI